MTKIDLKDRKILYELDLNCRQSNAQIGKKVGLKRDVVAYRIKRMQDEGIIKNFWTAINTFKLGYDVFRIYINFQYLSPKVKEEIVQHFIDYKNVWAALSLKAEIDFDVIVWIKDVYEFYKFWNITLDKFEDYFAEYTFSLYVEAYSYKKSYLLPENHESDRLMYVTRSGGKSIEIDKTDYLLLNEMAIKARTPLVDIADKLGISSQSVNYRLKNLMKNGVINAFRVNVDLSKLGFHHHKLEVYLRDHKKRKAIWDYVKEKNYCDTLNVSVGWADLEFELVVEGVDELSKVIDDINSKFADSIKKQTFWIVDEYHKERWLPEIW